MAFGQAAGPPAPARRIAELAALLEERGYESFREARHPFGLTQRQAGGKFTGSEVDELIERLESEVDAGAPVVSPSPPAEEGSPASVGQQDRAAARRRKRDEETAVGLDADVMATELVNRGWCCIPPA